MKVSNNNLRLFSQCIPAVGLVLYTFNQNYSDGKSFVCKDLGKGMWNVSLCSL